jgi:hypothetical protein
MIRPIIDGMESAVSGDEQRQEGAGHREHEGGEDGHRLDEIAEQQDQHDVDAQHAGQHGQAEAGEQFAHRLGVADRRLHHAGRQVASGWAGPECLFSISPSGCWFSSISKLMLRRRS